MQDPNTVDAEGQAGGPPPAPATDTTNPPVPPAPAITEPEPPAVGGEAMAVEVPPAQEQAADEPAAEELAATEKSAAKTEGAAGTDEAAHVTEEATGVAAAEAPAEDGGSPGPTPPATGLEAAPATAKHSAVSLVSAEPVANIDADADATEEASVTKEKAAEPVGSAVAVAEPAATIVEQTRGVWTDEQVEAFRNRLRETTADIVDKAAGAVIETINIVAAAIRSRTSSDRQR